MRAPLLIASFAALIVSGCAGPTRVSDLDAHQGVPPATFTFGPLTPNGPDVEVRARQLVAAQLEAHGFHRADAATYLIDVAVSAHPGKMALYSSSASRDDVPPGRFFFGECDDRAYRVAIIITDVKTGRLVSGERGGQLHCSGEDDAVLPRLVNVAVAAALR